MLLTNKKVLKVIVGIILGILIIIAMPIAATIAIFTGGIEVNVDELHRRIKDQLSAEQLDVIERMEEAMYAIEESMTEEGFEERIPEAYVLCYLLPEYITEEEFSERLVECFAEDQSSEQLIDAVNEEFGTELTVEEFQQAMEGIDKDG